MIPSDDNYEDEILDDLESDFTEEETQPSLTYAMNGNRFVGRIDGRQALEQAIYKILRTERYEYLMYSWDYGSELLNLIGKNIPYVMSILEMRIEDALSVDDRIEGIADFKCEKIDGKKLFIAFTVISTEGTIPIETEVEV